MLPFSSSSRSKKSCTIGRGLSHHPTGKEAKSSTSSSSSSSKEGKTFWIETTSKECILAALESGCASAFIVRDEAMLDKFMKFTTHADVGGDAARTSGENFDGGKTKTSMLRWFRREEENTNANGGGGSLVEFSSGKTIASIVTITNPEDVSLAAKRTGVVVVDVSENDWSIIPAENLVAASAERGGEVEFIACVKTSEEALEQLEALETGVNGVVLKTDDVKEVRLFSKVVDKIKKRGRENERLEVAKVTNVKNCGTGDRACVDCSTNFKPGEGLLVGNFANGLFLVHSECISGEGYVNSRPFRVNAGAVHSYVQMPDGRTGYLSELKAGEVVLRVNAEGETEEATVGRVKIERRSMVLVEAEKDGETYSCLLQNAETVRLICNNKGEAKSVAALRKGDEVLIKIGKQARHTGIAIDEDTWCER